MATVPKTSTSSAWSRSTTAITFGCRDTFLRTAIMAASTYTEFVGTAYTLLYPSSPYVVIEREVLKLNVIDRKEILVERPNSRELREELMRNNKEALRPPPDMQARMQASPATGNGVKGSLHKAPLAAE